MLFNNAFIIYFIIILTSIYFQTSLYSVLNGKQSFTLQFTTNHLLITNHIILFEKTNWQEVFLPVFLFTDVLEISYKKQKLYLTELFKLLVACTRRGILKQHWYGIFECHLTAFFGSFQHYLKYQQLHLLRLMRNFI